MTDRHIKPLARVRTQQNFVHDQQAYSTMCFYASPAGTLLINQHSKTNASLTTQRSKLPPCPPSMPNYLLSCRPSTDSSMINKHAKAHASLPNQCTKQRFSTQHSKYIASTPPLQKFIRAPKTDQATCFFAHPARVHS